MTTLAQQHQSPMSRGYGRDKPERSTGHMLDVNWVPVGVVLAVVTGVASLATFDLQTVTVVVMAFVSGVLVGRETLRRSERRTADGGHGE